MSVRTATDDSPDPLFGAPISRVAVLLNLGYGFRVLEGIVARPEAGRLFPFHDEAVVNRIRPSRSAQGHFGVRNKVNLRLFCDLNEMRFDYLPKRGFEHTRLCCGFNYLS